MESLFYTEDQLRVFAEDLPAAFLESGFEILEEPYIDRVLCGFRATFVRRYQLHQPNLIYDDGILTTIIHVVGLPYGQRGQKMVILSAPRNLDNEPVSETVRLKVRFNDDGIASVVAGTNNDSSSRSEASSTQSSAANQSPENNKQQECDNTSSSQSFANHFKNHLDRHQLLLTTAQFGQSGRATDAQFNRDLIKYVSHIIEIISPGLIQLPTEMKLEVLKKLSVDSIIKMSQVNNEFRSLIFERGESLWRHLCRRDFNIKFINRLVHKSWMELYRDTYVIHQVEICRKERALPGLPERPALLPAPYRLQIGWLPEVLQVPFNADHQIERLALEFHPLHRVGSLDSLL